VKKTEILYIPLLFLIIYTVYFNPPSLGLLSYIFYLTIGGFVLVKGSDVFIEGAVSIAARLGVSEHTIGLTVVAFGTSVPELAVSVIAAFQGHTETAWGNVLGSNTTNILLVLGAAMILMPLKPSKYAYHDSLYMILVSAVTLCLALEGSLQFYDGIVLLILYGIFIYMLWKREEIEEEESCDATLGFVLSVVYIVFGVMGVASGADAVVEGAVGISRLLGVSEVAIAASIVALGTSLPELMTSIMATIKKYHGIAVGNVVGSNIVNLGVVLGASAVIRNIPMDIMSPAVIFFGVSALLTALILKKKYLSKISGTIFLTLYVLFLFFLYIF